MESSIVRNKQSDSIAGASEPGARRSQPAVVITGPPWPRSGSGRVMQSQIQYYRSRGYRTILIAVPFRWNFSRNSPVWDEVRDGINELGADYTLLAAIEPKEFARAKFAATLRYGWRGTALDWIVEMGRSAELTQEEMQLLRDSNVRLLHANHVFTLGFAAKLKGALFEKKKRCPLILDTHDIQSHVVHEKKELNPWTKRLDTEPHLLRSEIRHLRDPEVLVHDSAIDFAFFDAELPTKAHFLALPTINDEFARQVKGPGPSIEPVDLLFVGDWHAHNLAGIRWFFTDVWPLIADRSYNFKIVGRIALGFEKELPEFYAKFRNHFAGEVTDLTSWYRAARCVVAPMISGTGVSIKTVEALAAGKAFVGTSKAFRGMPVNRLEEMGVKAYDEPCLFAEAIISALQDREAAERASQTAYQALFSTEACFSVRDQSLAAAFRQTESLSPGVGH